MYCFKFLIYLLVKESILIKKRWGSGFDVTLIEFFLKKKHLKWGTSSV
ncbi:hypothetical protein M2419_002631 [Sphingobacterium sp. BIGb0116]|nr:hypothetical protein [Sphingobacterium sp. BIGb0116]